jgi:demethoxyubiquinone hydroxylase (CLK1/Coq7/Cat5 family)
LEFLKKYDAQVFEAVESIKADELSHQEYAQIQGVNAWYYQPIFNVVRLATELAIWLSSKL